MAFAGKREGRLDVTTWSQPGHGEPRQDRRPGPSDPPRRRRSAYPFTVPLTSPANVPPTGWAIVACFGNVLRADDGVGPAVAHALIDVALPSGAVVMEVGIGGIHLVQELLRGDTEVLLIVDAVDLGRPAGTVVIQRPNILDVSTLSVDRRRDELADMHLATPARAFMVALGLGVLPATTLIVGVQTTDTEEPRQGLSDVTMRTVPVVVSEIQRLLAEHQPVPAAPN